MPTAFRTIEVDNASVAGVNYIDITFTMSYGITPPIVTATIPTHDINVWASNVTTTGARLNFSVKYTGTIYYQVIDRG